MSFLATYPPSENWPTSDARAWRAVTPTENPDERTPAPEEDIQEVTETVEETLEAAPLDPDDDPDGDDEG